jgi:hypothetical protein
MVEDVGLKASPSFARQHNVQKIIDSVNWFLSDDQKQQNVAAPQSSPKTGRKAISLSPLPVSQKKKANDASPRKETSKEAKQLHISIGFEDLLDEGTTCTSLCSSSLQFANSGEFFESSLHNGRERENAGITAASKELVKSKSESRHPARSSMKRKGSRVRKETAMAEHLSRASDKRVSAEDLTKNESQPRLKSVASKQQVDCTTRTKTSMVNNISRKSGRRVPRKDLVKSRSEPRLRTTSSNSQGTKKSSKKSLPSVSEHGPTSPDQIVAGDLQWCKMSRSSYNADDKHYLCLSPVGKRKSSVSALKAKASGTLTRSLSLPTPIVVWDYNHSKTCHEGDANQSKEKEKSKGDSESTPAQLNDITEHDNYERKTENCQHDTASVTYGIPSVACKAQDCPEQLESVVQEESAQKCMNKVANIGENVHENDSVAALTVSSKDGKISRGREAPPRQFSGSTLGQSVYEAVLSGDESEFECDSENDDSVSTKGKPEQVSLDQIKPPNHVNDRVVFDLKDMETTSPVCKQHTKVKHYPQVTKEVANNTSQKKECATKRIKSQSLQVMAKNNSGDECVENGLAVDDVFDGVGQTNSHPDDVTPMQRKPFNCQKVTAGLVSLKMPTLLEKSSFHGDSNETGKLTFSTIKGDGVVTFRNRNRLSKQEMGDIIAHLKECEETGADVRWDLIYQMIDPREGTGIEHPPTRCVAHSESDCRSLLTDSFDNESCMSWFSLNADFDDCASSVTFLVDSEDTEVGASSKRSRPAPVSIEKASFAREDSEGLKVPIDPCDELKQSSLHQQDLVFVDPKEDESVALVNALHAFVSPKDRHQNHSDLMASSVCVFEETEATLAFFQDPSASLEELDGV